MTTLNVGSPLPVRCQWLSAWDLRLLLPVALVLASVAATARESHTAVLMFATAGILALAARPRWSRLLLLLLPANGLLLSAIALMALMDIHPHLPEGDLALGLLWWLRGNAAVLLVLILLGSRPFPHIIDAAVWWRCPHSLAQIAQLMLGFHHLLWQEWQRVLQQARLRGWRLRANRRSMLALGWMLGAMLQRSEQRARRVDSAVRLRGGPAPLRYHPWPRLCRWQLACTLLLIILALALPLLSAYAA